MITMHWILCVTIGCALCSVVYSAPQEVSDLVKEETFTEVKGIIPSEKIDKVVNTVLSSREERQVTDTGSEKPVELITEAAATTKKPLSVTKPPKKPLRATTVKPVEVVNPVTPTTTANPNRRYPCTCGDGLCSCCSGLLLENFNVPIRSKACANITYEPEDFAFNFKLLFNNRVLYKTRMSAKNPRPVCIPLNRYFGVKMCVKLSNIYMSGRNIHACLDMEGYWDDESAFDYSFNCFRIGSNGVGIVSPEDGGGLPPPPDEEEQTDEDYDDSARGWTGDVEVVPN